MDLSRVLIACALCFAGCKDKKTGALETFASKFSCPEDQVTVKPRTDLDPATEMAPHFQTKPSDEVAADPARMAKWTADQAAKHATWANGFGGYDMFQVSGCGHDIIYACHHPTYQKGAANGTRGDLVTCEESRVESDANEAARDAAKAAAKAAKKQEKEDAKAAKRAAKTGSSESPSDP